MADGRISKTVKLPYLRNRLTDFGEIWHGDADWLPTGDRLLKFWIFPKNQDGGGRQLENHKNRDVLLSNSAFLIFAF